MTNESYGIQFIKENAWKVATVIIGFIIAWTLIQGRVDNLEAKAVAADNERALLEDELEILDKSTDDSNTLILQRLSIIETKIDYIIENNQEE